MSSLIMLAAFVRLDHLCRLRMRLNPKQVRLLQPRHISLVLLLQAQA